MRGAGWIVHNVRRPRELVPDEHADFVRLIDAVAELQGRPGPRVIHSETVAQRPDLSLVILSSETTQEGA